MRRPISLKVYSITLSLLILMVIVTALSARNLRSLNNEVAALSRYYIPLDQQAGSIETLVRQQVVHLERILLLLQAPRREQQPDGERGVDRPEDGQDGSRPVWKRVPAGRALAPLEVEERREGKG